MKKNMFRLFLRHQTALYIIGRIKKHPERRKKKKGFKTDLKTYTDLNKHGSFTINKKYIWPCLDDKGLDAGDLGSYFWQDLWCAKLVFENSPVHHFDIGSRIDGFIAHLSVFRENIHLIDIRPLDTQIPGVDFIQADATTLGGVADESIESLSALCSLEHFGLGRYGDPIDPDACFKAFNSIIRVLKKGGHAYISVPIGKEHVEFNAHRIFSPRTVIDSFKHMELVEFSVTKGESIEKDVSIDKYNCEDDNMGTRFGLFHFVKL